MQRFIDYADDQVDRAVRAKRKGALTAYRDATLFKVIYGWGLRRTESPPLQVSDIDAPRRRGRVPQGTGGQDRLVPQAPQGLACWRARSMARW